MLKVGVIGVGTVGTSVVNILKKNAKIITARAGQEISVVSGVVNNLEKDRGVDIKLSKDQMDIINDPEIDVVVELMGGVEGPFEVVKAALRHNAAAVIFAHNHPSGMAEPSKADEQITNRLKSALQLVDVRVLDHLVVGEEIVSFAERGLL